MSAERAAIHEAVSQQEHVLISGRSGSGKSHVLRDFIETRCSSTRVAVCAPTAQAASNIGGSTIHLRLGLGALVSQHPVDVFTTIQRRKADYRVTWTFLTQTDILVLDEVSMVSPTLFRLLEYLFRRAAPDTRTRTRPFGRVTLVMVGDFTQLPPVPTEGSRPDEIFVFQTAVWRSMNICRIVLDRCKRQEGDRRFMQILDNVRRGYLSSSDRDALTAQRVHTGDATYLFPLRAQAMRYNRQSMLRVGETVQTFLPFVYIDRTDDTYLSPALARTADTLRRDPARLEAVLGLYTVEVCQRARVMLMTNTLASEGVVNGSIGHVESIRPDGITVLFNSGKRIVIMRHTFVHTLGPALSVCMDQYPLQLAWALTVHKVQGLTLPCVHLDATCCFSPGQLYVALSRVSSLDDIRVDSLPDIVHVLSDAVDFEQGAHPTRRTLRIT